MPTASASRRRVTDPSRAPVVSKLAKFLLTATAFAPALLTCAAVLVISGEYLIAGALVVGCVLVALLCGWLLRFAKYHVESMGYSTVTVESADNEVFNFLLIYLLPIVSVDWVTSNWPVWVLVALIFCVVVATGYGYHFNPLLATFPFRYHFYKVTETGGLPHVLITKRHIHKTGETLHVVRLFEYVLLEKKPPD